MLNSVRARPKKSTLDIFTGQAVLTTSSGKVGYILLNTFSPFSSEKAIVDSIAALKAQGPIHLIINATGALTLGERGPEKRLADLDATTMAQALWAKMSQRSPRPAGGRNDPPVVITSSAAGIMRWVWRMPAPRVS